MDQSTISESKETQKSMQQ